MKRFLLSLLVFIVLLSSACAFAETTIKAEVDKKVMSADEDLTYKVVISSSENSVPAPELPKFEDFTVLSSARSSTMSFKEGTVKTFAVYAVILAPAKTGTCTIAPATLKIKNTVYATDSIAIEVKEGKEKSAPPQSPGEPRQSLPGSDPGSEQPDSQEPKYTL